MPVQRTAAEQAVVRLLTGLGGSGTGRYDGTSGEAARGRQRATPQARPRGASARQAAERGRRDARCEQAAQGKQALGVAPRARRAAERGEARSRNGRKAATRKSRSRRQTN